jgi:hypothetical protein
LQLSESDHAETGDANPLLAEPTPDELVALTSPIGDPLGLVRYTPMQPGEYACAELSAFLPTLVATGARFLMSADPREWDRLMNLLDARRAAVLRTTGRRLQIFAEIPDRDGPLRAFEAEQRVLDALGLTMEEARVLVAGARRVHGDHF